MVGAGLFPGGITFPKKRMGRCLQNVTVIDIFALQPAYTEQGLGQVSGTPSDATKKLQTQLGKMVGTVFAAKWPTADTNDPMTGIMGPWDNSQGGTAPKCATDQITLDFGSWGIDAEPGIIDHMAKTITMHLANTMGSTGTMAGSSAVTGSRRSIGPSGSPSSMSARALLPRRA